MLENLQRHRFLERLREFPGCHFFSHSGQASTIVAAPSEERRAGHAVHTNLQYTGQFQDSESNLYYLRARYYDPATTQFITVDPLTASTGDRYSYAAGNPATFTDPLGLDAIDSIGTAFIGFGDEYTFGLSAKARNAMGIEWDPCSNQSAYQTGGVLASINPKGLLKRAGRLAWKGITRKAANGVDIAGARFAQNGFSERFQHRQEHACTLQGAHD